MTYDKVLVFKIAFKIVAIPPIDTILIFDWQSSY